MIQGDPVVYTYWMPGWVTYHADVEDCVRMGMGQYYGHWEDLRCNTTLDYICEFGMYTRVDIVIKNTIFISRWCVKHHLGHTPH